MSADLISNLPDTVIINILLHLPYKEAVKTSILSKQWRYHWSSLTQVSVYLSPQIANPAQKFLEMIYPLITLHRGNIAKFSLEISLLQIRIEIDFLVYFLSRKGIKNLVLKPTLPSILPSSLFTCSKLTHLELEKFLIEPPSSFQGFEKLISLKLCHVQISRESLHSLVSNSPLLEHLLLYVIHDASDIEINAPMLKFFDFTGDASSICLKSVPSLLEVFLYCLDEEHIDFAKFFTPCSSFNHLVMRFPAFLLYADEGYDVPRRLPFYLSSVKRFDISSLSLRSSYFLSYALCLIRSFPFLEYLKIEVFSSQDEYHDEEHFVDLPFTHLREVEIELHTGSKPEMQLIEVLLANCHLLHTIVIDLRHERIDTVYCIDKVSTFLRASTVAEVVYLQRS